MLQFNKYFNDLGYVKEGEKFFNFLKLQENYDKKTEEASSIRWKNSLKMEEDPGFLEHQFKDFCKRYGFQDEAALRCYLSDVNVIAEIGAGEGRAVDWYLKYSKAFIFALEISDSVYDLNEKYKNEPRVVIVKADISNNPFKEGVVDLVSCEQSIHHLSNPGKVFKSLAKTLTESGRVLLSVYAQKSLIREKFDFLIRNSIAGMESSRKYMISEQMALIGETLAKMNVEIDIPEHFTEFGSLCGQKMSLQLFIYYAVMKCFWNNGYSKQKNIEINFDWYNYPTCSTVSLNDAVQWFVESKMVIEYVDSNESNVNIRGWKNQ